MNVSRDISNSKLSRSVFSLVSFLVSPIISFTEHCLLFLLPSQVATDIFGRGIDVERVNSKRLVGSYCA